MIGLKGIGGHAILPFLETPGTKVQIVMIIHVGNSCAQVWGLIAWSLHLDSIVETNVIFIVIVIPMTNCGEKQTLKSLP